MSFFGPPCIITIHHHQAPTAGSSYSLGSANSSRTGDLITLRCVPTSPELIIAVIIRARFANFYRRTIAVYCNRTFPDDTSSAPDEFWQHQNYFWKDYDNRLSLITDAHGNTESSTDPPTTHRPIGQSVGLGLGGTAGGSVELSVSVFAVPDGKCLVVFLCRRLAVMVDMLHDGPLKLSRRLLVWPVAHTTVFWN